jgi:hypothetical protein
MTLQARDRAHFQGEEYFLWDWDGEGFFDPQEYGLVCAGAFSTACWRGYCSGYVIKQNQLLLNELEINLDEAYLADTTPPLLNGRSPLIWDWSRWDQTDKKAPSPPACGEFRYQDAQLRISFTGGLLLRKSAKIALSSIPRVANPARVMELEKTHELIFDQGQLIEAQDHSSAVVSVLSDLIEQSNGTLTNVATIQEKLNACFTYNYMV